MIHEIPVVPAKRTETNQTFPRTFFICRSSSFLTIVEQIHFGIALKLVFDEVKETRLSPGNDQVLDVAAFKTDKVGEFVRLDDLELLVFAMRIFVSRRVQDDAVIRLKCQHGAAITWTDLDVGCLGDV